MASFNPLYGQGMSSAARHASALSLHLRSNPDFDAPARDFLALQRVVADAAGRISAPEDSTGPDTRTTRKDRVARRVIDLIVNASITDRPVNPAFQQLTRCCRTRPP